MQTQTISQSDKEKTKKKIFSIVNKLESLELKSLEHYAEYLAQRNNEAKFLEILRNAKPEDEELGESEVEGLRISKDELKKGKFRELKDYMKERNLL
jgi:hypothetical protein